MRTRNLKLFCIAAMLLAGACHRAPTRTVTPVPPAPQPTPATPPPITVPSTWPELPLPPSRLPAPPEPPIPRDFRDGETSFQNGKYLDAARSYEKYIREDPTTQFKDVAMFKLGVLYSLSCSSGDCRTRSRDQFKRLVSRFPQSPYSAEARFILSLLADIEKMKDEAKSRDEKIKKLTDELEKLKSIDLRRRK